jgi:hypothetical protein
LVFSREGKEPQMLLDGDVAAVTFLRDGKHAHKLYLAWSSACNTCDGANKVGRIVSVAYPLALQGSVTLLLRSSFLPSSLLLLRSLFFFEA